MTGKVWLDFALECNYINNETYKNLFKEYDNVLGKLVNMSLQPEKWTY